MLHHSHYLFDGTNEEKDLGKVFKKFNEVTDLAKQIKVFQDELGATGKFPDGKITETYEGEIKIGITISQGNIIVEFGKPVHWFGMTKDQAKDFAELLLEKVKEIPD